MQETQKTEERHWISRWPTTLAIVVVALGISTAIVLSQHHRSAPARTTSPTECVPLPGVPMSIYSHLGCTSFKTLPLPAPSAPPTPAQCRAQGWIYTPQGCFGSEGNGSTTNSTTNTTAITPPPTPVSTPAQCQAQHDYYTPQGCIGSNGNMSPTSNTGTTTAITPPPTVDGYATCPDHEIYTTQGCIESEGGQTIIYGTPPVMPRMYPPPPKGKCVKTSATTWTCTPTRPVTG